MTRSRILLGIATLVCLGLAQTAERAGTGIVAPKKKSIAAVTSGPAKAVQVAEQKSVSTPEKEETAPAAKPVSRPTTVTERNDDAAPVRKPANQATTTTRRSDDAYTGRQAYETKPSAGSHSGMPSVVRKPTVSRPGASTGNTNEAVERWWSKEPARTAPPAQPRGEYSVKAPTKKSMPEVVRPEPPSGGRGQGGDHGRGRGGDFDHGWPGWREHGRHGRRHHDFDFWRYGYRHHHRHGYWGIHWIFGPIVYVYEPVYVPGVVRYARNHYGVYVRSTGDDAVGSRFAHELRDQLYAQGLNVVYDQSDAALELYLVSMDRDPDGTGRGSAISVSYVWFPGERFITAQIIDVGSDQIEDMAQDVAGYAADIIEDYR